MPNQRALGRSLCAVWLFPEFLEALDRARKLKHMDRSTFIRWAISVELQRLGIEFDEQHVYPPDRTGKGGPKYHVKLHQDLARAAESSSPYRAKHKPKSSA